MSQVTVAKIHDCKGPSDADEYIHPGRIIAVVSLSRGGGQTVNQDHQGIRDSSWARTTTPLQRKTTCRARVVQMALHDRCSRFPGSHRTSYTTEGVGCQSGRLAPALSCQDGSTTSFFCRKDRTTRTECTGLKYRTDFHCNMAHTKTVRSRLCSRAELSLASGIQSHSPGWGQTKAPMILNYNTQFAPRCGKRAQEIPLRPEKNKGPARAA